MGGMWHLGVLGGLAPYHPRGEPSPKLLGVSD